MAVISAPAKVLSSRPQAHSQGTSVRGNVDLDSQSLRGFLRLVETEYPDELLRIRQPIDLRFDSTAMVFELDHAGKSPVVVFENVSGSGMPVVTNVAGNRKLLAACLGVEPGNLPTAFRERCQKYIPCETGGRGAWDDVVDRGRRGRPDEAADPAAVHGRRGALHHRRPDRRRAIRSPASTPPASTG